MKFNGILDDKSSDTSPSQGSTVINHSKFNDVSPEKGKKKKQVKAPNQSQMDVRKLNIQRSKTKMSKMDISYYEVELSDYKHLTNGTQNDWILRKTMDKRSELCKVSQQTLTESL